MPLQELAKDTRSREKLSKDIFLRNASSCMPRAWQSGAKHDDVSGTTFQDFVRSSRHRERELRVPSLITRRESAWISTSPKSICITDDRRRARSRNSASELLKQTGPTDGAVVETTRWEWTSDARSRRRGDYDRRHSRGTVDPPALNMRGRHGAISVRHVSHARVDPRFRVRLGHVVRLFMTFCINDAACDTNLLLAPTRCNREAVSIKSEASRERRARASNYFPLRATGPHCEE